MPIHKDVIGNEVKENMVVLYPDRKVLKLGKITKVETRRKMIDIKGLEDGPHHVRRYANDVIYVDHPSLTLRLLSNGK